LQQCHWFAILIEKHSTDVTKFNHEHVLLKATLDSRDKQPSEEGVELAQLCDKSKLVLETFPNIVRF